MKESNLTNNNGVIDFEPVFIRLNEELSAAGLSLIIVCAGGYAMQIHGYRGTADIDAFYKSNEKLDAIIQRVGDEFGINKPDELWLNNSISNLNPDPAEEFCETKHAYSALVVKAVSLNYLVGMKLESGREQDLIDVGTILKHDNNEKPFMLHSVLTDMGFKADISVILDTYEKAHGMDWLDAFYIGHQNELYNYL